MPLQTSGLMVGSLTTSYCTKESPNNLQDCWDRTNFKFFKFWLWLRGQRRPPSMPSSFKLTSRKDTTHQNVSHHSVVAPRKINLIFLKKKSHLRKLWLQSQPKDTERKWPGSKCLRNQIWYPKTGKNRSRDGWARAAEKVSIRNKSWLPFVLSS